MFERTGPLDVVVNNAADQTYQPVLEVEHKAWNRTLAVNLTGPMLVTKGAARSMPAGGAIVNVASIHAFIALQGAAAYTASKAGLAMLTRQAAVELGERGIRVNAVAPGAIDVQGEERLRRPGGHPRFKRLPLQRAGTPRRSQR